MVMYFHIYDDKSVDITTDSFKNLIADSVKQTILNDWEKFVKIEQYNETDENGIKYNTIVKICDS